MDWLREFYGRIVVPVAVAAELEAGRRLGARVPELTAFPWIEVRRAPEPMPAFPRFIHRGEAEVLAQLQAEGFRIAPATLAEVERLAGE